LTENGGASMKYSEKRSSQKPIDVEEYLFKRQQIREAEEQRTAGKPEILKKSPAYMLAELYV